MRVTASDVTVRQVAKVNSAGRTCVRECVRGGVWVCGVVPWWVRDVGRVSEVSFQFRWLRFSSTEVQGAREESVDSGGSVNNLSLQRPCHSL